MKPFLTGVVAGKFRPFHKGHQRVIAEALRNCTRVYVLLVRRSDDKWSAESRALAIYETFVGEPVKVYIVDDINTDDTTTESYQMWAEYTKAILGFYPQAVYSSEDYGIGWAKAMGAAHVMVDKSRIKVPISGTEITEHPYGNAKYLPGPMAREITKRVVVIGAESTGTTTLANALGEHYACPVVPEFGRLVDEWEAAKGTPLADIDASWTPTKFRMVAKAQEAMENRMAEIVKGLLICDTDSVATTYWVDYYFRRGIKSLDAWTGAGMRGLGGHREFAIKHHSLYILTYDDIPFTQDDYGLRQGESLRHWMTGEFMKELVYMQHNGIPFIIVQGDHETRMRQATETIDSLVLDKELVG